MVTAKHTVAGGGGLKLHVREWGNEDGAPILFIHGWSQNHLCWSKQYDSVLAGEFRLAAFDNRGHGMSEKPLEPEHYSDADLWADDVAAVIDALGLDRPVLVGWSYGGFIMCDYVRAHGMRRIAGVNFVGAAVTLNQDVLGTLIGPGFLDHFAGATAPDLPTNIEAMRAFVRACTAKPLPENDFETALCWNIVVPPEVRANLARREIDSGDALASLDVPVLVTHGRLDNVVLPAMVQHVLDSCPQAEASWYEGIGHAPFLEDPERFNQELAAFARRARASA